MTQADQPNESREIVQILHMLVNQVGRLTEGLTEIKYIAQEQNHAIARLADAQSETAKTQAESISRLITLLERQQ